MKLGLSLTKCKWKWKNMVDPISRDKRKNEGDTNTRDKQNNEEDPVSVEKQTLYIERFGGTELSVIFACTVVYVVIVSQIKGSTANQVIKHDYDIIIFFSSFAILFSRATADSWLKYKIFRGYKREKDIRCASHVLVDCGKGAKLFSAIEYENGEYFFKRFGVKYIATKLDSDNPEFKRMNPLRFLKKRNSKLATVLLQHSNFAFRY